MKKLMIAAAIVCAAVASHAATTSWNWSTGTSVLKAGYDNSSVMKGATIYLFASDATAQSDKTAQTAMLKALQDGTTKASDLAGLALATATTDNDGKVLDASPVNFTRDDVTVGATKYYYELVMSDDGKYAYISGLAGAAAQDTGKDAILKTSSAASGNLRDDTGKAAYGNPGWYAVASVPEPTSGLLLLLGVAGLALKRKRA